MKVFVSSFIGNDYIASWEHPVWQSPVDGQYIIPCNQALFCSECGEIWGRRVIEGHNKWTVMYRNCLKHKDGWTDGLILSAEETWGNVMPVAFYPKEVLAHDFLILMEDM